MSSNNNSFSFITDLVSRREDNTRIVSSLPLDKPGSSGSKLTDSSLGVRFGFSRNVTPAQQQQQSSNTNAKPTNSSRSVLGTFIELRGVLEPPSLVAVDDDLGKEILFSTSSSETSSSSSPKNILSTFSWFFCPTNSQLRQHPFWTDSVDHTCAFEDPTQHHLPYSLCYTGVQFGIPANQLGDGRIVTLCETTIQKSLTKTEFCEIQIKGGGIKTPYSRGLDGLITLQSALKEFLLSKLLRSLNIPVAAVLGVYKENGGRECFRDNASSININQGRGDVNERNGGFVDEDQEDEVSARSSPSHPCGVLLRIISCPIRVGTFEYLVKTQQWNLMKKVIKYLARVHFVLDDDEQSQTSSSSSSSHDDIMTSLLLHLMKQISKRGASLVAKWQVNGFVHGSLNTDNISIVGETLDLATGCFMHYFDDDFVQNPDDADNGGMYRFGRQPQKYFEALERLAFLFFSFYVAITTVTASDAGEEEVKTKIQEFKLRLSRVVAENFQETFNFALHHELCNKKLGLTKWPSPRLPNLILKTLKEKKPPIDEFYEKVWNLVRGEKEGNGKRRSRNDDNTKNNDFEEFEIELQKLVNNNNNNNNNEIEFDEDSEYYIPRSIPNKNDSSSALVLNNDEVQGAYEKAYSSAFPKVYKTYQDDKKSKRNLDDCGCG